MKAIVYTSDAGHTARYAELLGQKTGLPVYPLEEALRQLQKNTQIIYLGWLMANSIKGYRKANKQFTVSAVCAVGLCDTGTAIPEVRKVNRIPEAVPLFTMQGGMDKEKLPGSYRFVIRMLTKVMDAKKAKTEADARMVYLLKNERDYVNQDNTAAFMQWYGDATGKKNEKEENL